MSNRKAEWEDHLYFIRIKDGPVKIGRAGNVQARLKTLQCASPYELVLVGVVEEAGVYEAAFHTRLDDYRIRGEWFEWKGLVAEAITTALTTGKWRTLFGMVEPEDWWIGSPLYEKAEARHVSG